MKQCIHETIRRKRMEIGLTQRELADRLNVSFQAVSKWERGLNLPDLLLLPALCGVLGISADELLAMQAAPSTEANPPREAGEAPGVAPRETIPDNPLRCRRKRGVKHPDTKGGSS